MACKIWKVSLCTALLFCAWAIQPSQATGFVPGDTLAASGSAGHFLRLENCSDGELSLSQRCRLQCDYLATGDRASGLGRSRIKSPIVRGIATADGFESLAGCPAEIAAAGPAQFHVRSQRPARQAHTALQVASLRNAMQLGHFGIECVKFAKHTVVSNSQLLTRFVRDRSRQIVVQTIASWGLQTKAIRDFANRNWDGVLGTPSVAAGPRKLQTKQVGFGKKVPPQVEVQKPAVLAAPDSKPELFEFDQPAADAYWQYYEDCDHWDVEFASPVSSLTSAMIYSVSYLQPMAERDDFNVSLLNGTLEEASFEHSMESIGIPMAVLPAASESAACEPLSRFKGRLMEGASYRLKKIRSSFEYVVNAAAGRSKQWMASWEFDSIENQVHGELVGDGRLPWIAGIADTFSLTKQRLSAQSKRMAIYGLELNRRATAWADAKRNMASQRRRQQSFQRRVELANQLDRLSEAISSFADRVRLNDEAL